MYSWFLPCCLKVNIPMLGILYHTPTYGKLDYQKSLRTRILKYVKFSAAGILVTGKSSKPCNIYLERCYFSVSWWSVLKLKFLLDMFCFVPFQARKCWPYVWNTLKCSFISFWELLVYNCHILEFSVYFSGTLAK